jgi:hypothetical protein
MIWFLIFFCFVVANMGLYRMVPGVLVRIFAKSKIPSYLFDKHTDWPWWLQWVPRWATVCFSKKPPTLIAGVIDEIPPPGHFRLSWPLDFEWQSKSGFLRAIGISRYDHNGQYYQSPRGAWKQITKEEPRTAA